MIKDNPLLLKSVPSIRGKASAQVQDGVGRMKVRIKDAGLRGSSARESPYYWVNEGCDEIGH